MAGCHDGAVPVLEFKQTDDPTLALKGAPDLAVYFVQAAAVAHEGATGGRCDQGAKGCDAILSGHNSRYGCT